jgi:16S rRNA (cytosine967-C5)-methyltransferase
MADVVAVARKVAFEVLQKTEKGGYASDLLLASCEGLDSRDAGLASEIVFGCLRRQAQLDWLIAQGAKRDPRKLDAACASR